MRLSEVLAVPSLRHAVVVAASGHLHRTVRWAHVVDIPDPTNAAQPDQLLLTTGYSWPRDDQALKVLTRIFVNAGVAAVVLARPCFVTGFPQAMIRVAEDSGLPLIEVPWEIRFAQVTEEINSAIITDQFSLIERSAKVHRRMTEAAVGVETLQELAYTIGEVTGCSVIFEDTRGIVLAVCDTGVSDDAFRACVAAGTCKHLRHLLEKTGEWDRVEHSDGALRVAIGSEAGVTPRIYCPIHLKGELIGYIQMVKPNADDEDERVNLQAADHAAVVAALYLANERRLAMLETRLGSSLLDAILEGHFDNSERSAERARLWGMDDSGRYRVVIAVMGEELPLSPEAIVLRDDIADECGTRFHPRGGMRITSTRLNQIILVLSADTDLAELKELLLRRQCGLAIGRDHQGVQGIRQSYIDAEPLVPFVIGPVVRYYEDLVIPRVLSGNEEAQTTFLRDLLAPLQETKNGKVLASTILELAARNFKFGLTAQELALHINTLRNRVSRACELAAIDLKDPEIRFRLELAARLHAFRGASNGGLDL